MAKATFKVGGTAYFAEDLTLDEISLCEDETGESWLAANPYRSAKWTRALTIRVLARTIGEERARAQVGAMSAKDALATLEMAPDDDDRPIEHVDGVPVVDPKADGDVSATTG